jgi:glucokinase
MVERDRIIESDAPVPAGLVADIGGTNARFALVAADGRIYDERWLAVVDYPDLVTAVSAYLREVPRPHPPAAVLAIATPMTADWVSMPNNKRWSFSITATQKALGLDRLLALNDFTALALAIPHLRPDEVRQVGGGMAQPEATLGVLGAGTGLGVSGLVRHQNHWTALMSEGGHVSFPALTAREWAVVEWLQTRFGHVSAERLLSGPGLANLYEALAALDGWTPATLAPEDITERVRVQECPRCSEAVDLFCAGLGTIAGNLALTLGALGGIYIGGGLVPALGDLFDRSAFRERFEAKGRFRDYLAAIPTYVITATNLALRGAAAALRD